MTIIISALAFGASLALGTGAATTPNAPTINTSAVTAVQSMSAEATMNAPYNAFLTKYISQRDGVNLVNYSGVTARDKTALESYITMLEGKRPSQMSDNEQLAFWFNLYNAKTISLILDNYPVASIRQIGSGFVSKGPWKEKLITVEGRLMSLDDIEHKTVRAKFDEPRVHYAFNCASIGCPNLAMKAWTASTMDADLTAAARAYVAHPRGVRIDSRGRVTASNIYKWFKKDFGSGNKAVLDHMRKYATGEKLEALNNATKINSYQYDWSLNQL